MAELRGKSNGQHRLLVVTDDFGAAIDACVAEADSVMLNVSLGPHRSLRVETRLVGEAEAEAWQRWREQTRPPRRFPGRRRWHRESRA